MVFLQNQSKIVFTWYFVSSSQ